MTELNKILTTFNRARVFLAVVHCIDERKARAAVETAREGGADGVFLINQGGMTAAEVLDLAADLTIDDPDFFVGVNLLGYGATYAVQAIDSATPAIWSDDSGVRAGQPEETDYYLGRFEAARRARAWDGLFFGGVAFKHQTLVPPEFYGTVARLAADGGVDVVTTSGPKTGSPPEVAKVQAMREAIGDHALAIASGVSIDNVGSFLPYVDAFIVSSSIESADGIFDPAKLRALAAAVHAYQP